MEKSMPQGKRMAALSIGVSDAKPLAYLGGATKSAHEFHDWARAAGYESTLITDDELPLTVPGLRAEFDKILAPGNDPIHRLVIYFAGHGLIREAEEALWLLSDWRSEQRAVAVEVLKRRLYRYGLNQITIIADACRFLPTNLEAADLTADAVLGQGPSPRPATPAIDKFVAAQDGAGTFIIPGSTPEEDRCLFSRVLLEGLWGTKPSAFSTILTDKITSRSLAAYLQAQVPTRALRYGYNVVPTLSPTFPEGDDIYLSSGSLPAPPAFPPWPEPRATPTESSPRPTSADMAISPSAYSPAMGSPRTHGGVHPDGDSDPPRRRRGLLKSAIAVIAVALLAPLMILHWSVRQHGGPSWPGLNRLPLAIGISIALLIGVRFLWRLISSRYSNKCSGPASELPTGDWVGDTIIPRTSLTRQLHSQLVPKAFESRSGFAIDGVKVTAFWTRADTIAKTQGQPNWWRVSRKQELVLGDPVPAVVEFEGGSWGAPTAYPHAVGAMIADERGISGLIYREADASKSGISATLEAIDQMEQGSLRANRASDYLFQLGSTRYAEPVLGVITAYLYDSIEDVESIRRIAAIFLQKNQAIPYDIALLAQLKAEWRDGLLWGHVPAVPERKQRSGTGQGSEWMYGEMDAGSGMVAGLWPWMRQGWALLDDPMDDESTLIATGLSQLSEYLQPARFATLNSQGGQKIVQLFGLSRSLFSVPSGETLG
jgi:hypothetical protein